MIPPAQLAVHPLKYFKGLFFLKEYHLLLKVYTWTQRGYLFCQKGYIKELDFGTEYPSSEGGEGLGRLCGFGTCDQNITSAKILLVANDLPLSYLWLFA